jgi:ribosomal protein S18 acetylase RimI-like enzyme
MSISYLENRESVSYEEVNRVLTEIFGAEKSKDTKHTETVFEKSQNFVFAFDSEKLVGVARAISDGEWSVIYNFGVLKEYRGRKIGSEMLRRLVAQLKGQHIFTNTLPDSIGFYEKNGFQRTKTAFTYVGDGEDAGRYGEGYFLPEGYKFENEFYPVDLPFAGHRKPEKKKEVDLRYTNSRDGVDYRRVNEIIAIAFGGRELRPEEESEERIARTKYLFDISEYVSFAYDGERLVGVARAITDGAEEAYIQNVAVDPSYQGYGIGWQVVVKLSEEIKQNGLNPFLHTHPGAVGFYNRKGFRRNKTAVDYMNIEGEMPPMPPEVEKGFYLPTGFRFADE